MREQRRGRRIAMTGDEVDAFLREERTCRVASVGGDGAPHVAPLWFVWDGEALWLNSIVASQRWTDLQRDPRVAVVVDAGEDFLQLRGVEIPSLVEAGHQGVLNVAVGDLPGVMHDRAVFFALLLGQIGAAMRADGHQVRRAVGKRDARSSKADLHDVLGKVAGRVAHLLMGGGDVAGGGVVIGSKVRADAAPPGGGDETGKRRAAIRADDRLRRFDHQLELERAGLDPQLRLGQLEQRGERLHLLWNGDFGQGDDQPWKSPSGLLCELSEKNVDGPKRASASFFAERLDADTDKGRQRPFLHAARDFARHLDGVAIFLGVRSRAVAVLEVDAEVFHRLALELVHDAGGDRIDER